ncbi:MAG: hypothetical protein KDJ52_08525 [Anaerolineae bacterium]|nr:hypothetical protein [Anaerolineae bacterium]
MTKVADIMCPVKFPALLEQKTRIAGAILNMNRSEFIRHAVQEKIERMNLEKLVGNLEREVSKNE